MAVEPDQEFGLRTIATIRRREGHLDRVEVGQVARVPSVTECETGSGQRLCMRPVSHAQPATSTRLRRPSLVWMLVRCDFTVLSEMNSSTPIS